MKEESTTRYKQVLNEVRVIQAKYNKERLELIEATKQNIFQSISETKHQIEILNTNQLKKEEEMMNDISEHVKKLGKIYYDAMENYTGNGDESS